MVFYAIAWCDKKYIHPDHGWFPGGDPNAEAITCPGRSEPEDPEVNLTPEETQGLREWLGKERVDTYTVPITPENMTRRMPHKGHVATAVPSIVGARAYYGSDADFCSVCGEPIVFPEDADMGDALGRFADTIAGFLTAQMEMTPADEGILAAKLDEIEATAPGYKPDRQCKHEDAAAFCSDCGLNMEKLMEVIGDNLRCELQGDPECNHSDEGLCGLDRPMGEEPDLDCDDADCCPPGTTFDAEVPECCAADPQCNHHVDEEPEPDRYLGGFQEQMRDALARIDRSSARIADRADACDAADETIKELNRGPCQHEDAECIGCSSGLTDPANPGHSHYCSGCGVDMDRLAAANAAGMAALDEMDREAQAVLSSAFPAGEKEEEADPHYIPWIAVGPNPEHGKHPVSDCATFGCGGCDVPFRADAGSNPNPVVRTRWFCNRRDTHWSHMLKGGVVCSGVDPPRARKEGAEVEDLMQSLAEAKKEIQRLYGYSLCTDDFTFGQMLQGEWCTECGAGRAHAEAMGLLPPASAKCNLTNYHRAGCNCAGATSPVVVSYVVGLLEHQLRVAEKERVNAISEGEMDFWTAICKDRAYSLGVVEGNLVDKR